MPNHETFGYIRKNDWIEDNISLATYLFGARDYIPILVYL